MNNPGSYNLGDVAVAEINAATTAAVVTSGVSRTGQAQAYIDQLEGMDHATLQANFIYGGGGGTLKAIVETTLDRGTTWIEVGRFAFSTASAEKLLAIKGLGERLTAYTPAALSDDVGLSGFFGDRFRASLLKAGSDYSGNTSLSLRLHAR